MAPLHPTWGAAGSWQIKGTQRMARQARETTDQDLKSSRFFCLEGHIGAQSTSWQRAPDAASKLARAVSQVRDGDRRKAARAHRLRPYPCPPVIGNPLDIMERHRFLSLCSTRPVPFFSAAKTCDPPLVYNVCGGDALSVHDGQRHLDVPPVRKTDGVPAVHRQPPLVESKTAGEARDAC